MPPRFIYPTSGGQRIVVDESNCIVLEQDRARPDRTIRITITKVKPASTSTSAGLFVGCHLYVYPPFTFFYAALWVDGYAEIASCFPSFGFNMILAQQLWQADFSRHIDPVGPQDVTPGTNTGFLDHNVDALCLTDGGPWAFRQQAAALIEFGGGYGTASGLSAGSWNKCNAL